jgi:hypothetical protein
MRRTLGAAFAGVADEAATVGAGFEQDDCSASAASASKSEVAERNSMKRKGGFKLEGAEFT